MFTTTSSKIHSMILKSKWIVELKMVNLENLNSGMKHKFQMILMAIILMASNSFAQPFIQKPKLVVGIVVDQMRHDYIKRYWDLYGETGFKKLVTRGYTFENAHFNYFPTYTGVGHSNISTGANPGHNGIIANDWFDRSLGKKVYCVYDSTMTTVGSNNESGKMSPHRLLTTTVGDELKLSSNFRSRVYGVALKDRGAILMAGHSADAAYWYDGETGNFVTSSYYLGALPKWVSDFNQKKIWDKYLDNTWKLSMPLDKIERVSTPDLTDYENVPKNLQKPEFPYDLKKIRKLYTPELLAYTPWGNTISFDFASELVRKEQLGEKGETDLLMLSLSTPDYVGHQYGVRAQEIADIYARLDRDLGEFISMLELRVGKENLVIFLTADHGAADNFNYSLDHKIPAGNFNARIVEEDLKGYLTAKYGFSPILSFKNMQIYLDKKLLKSKGISEEAIFEEVKYFLHLQEGVYKIVSASTFAAGNVTDEILLRYQRGYHPERCGDIYVIPNPGWMDMYWQNTGTTHGSVFTYDTHVPMIFYGSGISVGYTYDQVAISNIAPTLCAMLGINMPNACFEQPLIGYFRR